MFGQHLCAPYQDQDGRRRLTAAVVRGALAAGDRVMYMTPGPHDEALALLEAGGIETGRPLRGGQLLVPSFDEVFGDLATADLATLAQLGPWRPSGRRSASRWRRDSPACGSPARWAATPGQHGRWTELVRWERMVSQMLGEVGIAAICQYDQRQLDEPAIATIAAEHIGVATTGQRLPLALFIASARRRCCGSRANST